MKNRKQILIISILTLLNSAIASPDCGHNHGPAPSANETNNSTVVQVSKQALLNINLKDGKVQKRCIDNLVQSLGRIENIPETSFEISSRISGKVVKLYVKLGDKVKKGDKICQVESLLAGNPPPTVTLTASSDGVIESLNIVNGSSVQANTALATIVDAKQIYAIANVFEDNLAELKIGQTARIKIPALGNKVVEAKLVKFATSANAQTNTIDVYFQLDNENLELKNNMRAFFNIVTSSQEEVLCVPNSAIGGDFPLQYVFVQECPQDLIYTKTPVKIGNKDDNFTVVESVDLKEGDVIAISGIYQMQFLPAPIGEHSDDEESDDEHDYSHNDRFEIIPMAITHTHSEDHEHSFWHNAVDKFDSIKTSAYNITQTRYFSVLMKIGFGVSILLNIIFVISSFFTPKNRGEK